MISSLEINTGDMISSLVFNTGDMKSNLVFNTGDMIGSLLVITVDMISSLVFNTGDMISSLEFNTGNMIGSLVVITGDMISSLVFNTGDVISSLVFFFFHNLHLGFVHPLQDVALHQCLPSSSVCCFPNPCGSLLLCYVILPSSAWSSSRPLPSPWLPLCASPRPPIVL